MIAFGIFFCIVAIFMFWLSTRETLKQQVDRMGISTMGTIESIRLMDDLGGDEFIISFVDETGKKHKAHSQKVKKLSKNYEIGDQIPIKYLLKKHSVPLFIQDPGLKEGLSVKVMLRVMGAIFLLMAVIFCLV